MVRVTHDAPHDISLVKAVSQMIVKNNSLSEININYDRVEGKQEMIKFVFLCVVIGKLVNRITSGVPHI